MSHNGVPIQDISDTMGHKSTHVTETVYRHVIVPAIRGGASVMDDVFGEQASQASSLAPQSLEVEQRSGKPVELRGLEPLASCMPWGITQVHWPKSARAKEPLLMAHKSQPGSRLPLGGNLRVHRADRSSG
jgi:hypothetical protein